MPVTKPTKKAVKERDSFSCRKCKSNKDLEIHHVVPQRLGGPHALFNLVCLCTICHSKWHSMEYAMGIAYMQKRTVDLFYSWLKS